MTEPERRLSLEVPDEIVTGHYADFVAAWHTPDVFVLDFAALKGAPQVVQEEDVPVVLVPTRVVARVRIPPAQVFELMKALEQQLSAWEHETGTRQPDPDATPPPAG